MESGQSYQKLAKWETNYFNIDQPMLKLSGECQLETSYLAEISKY